MGPDGLPAMKPWWVIEWTAASLRFNTWAWMYLYRVQP